MIRIINDINDICGCEAEGCDDCMYYGATGEARKLMAEADRLDRLSDAADLRGDWDLAAQYYKRAVELRAEAFGDKLA